MTEAEFKNKVTLLGELTTEMFESSGPQKSDYAKEVRTLSYEISAASATIVKENKA